MDPSLTRIVRRYSYTNETVSNFEEIGQDAAFIPIILFIPSYPLCRIQHHIEIMCLAHGETGLSILDTTRVLAAVAAVFVFFLYYDHVLGLGIYIYR